MITLFRRIRQKLIDSGSITKYLLYAIGEILLVVIGILIALQVNNWNEERQEANRLQGYYREVQREVQDNIALSKEFVSSDSMLTSLIERSLRIIDNANPDSLSQLKNTLGAVGTNYNRTYSFPVTEDFIANGYINSVEDDSLKLGLRSLRLFLKRNDNLNQYINDQYQLKIEPFFNTRINYSRVVLDANKDDIYVGGPETDYYKLINDLEAWNIINFKLEIANYAYNTRRQGLNIMMFLERKLHEVIQE